MGKKKKKMADYLRDIIGEQKDEWIHPAIASHLGQKFPELTSTEALHLVKKFINTGGV